MSGLQRATVLVLTLCVVALGGWAAAVAGDPEVERPVAVEPASDGPALPAEVPEGDPEAPALDPDLGLMPAPEAACKAGWCSSDQQCIQWYGPGSECYIQPGQTCGQCIF